MVRKTTLVVFAALLLLVAAGCGGGGESYYVEEDVAEGEAGTSGGAAASGSTAAVVSADAATVQGGITLTGTAPDPGKIQMNADPTCAAHHGGQPVVGESVVVGAAGELANVFVYVKDYKGPVAAPAGAVLLDQAGCTYHPHVTGVQVGQQLVIRNSDETLHNVHALAQTNKEFNIGQPVKGMESVKTFDKPEVMVKIKCDVHSWMSSYVGVVGHPYFGVSDGSGNFTIAGLPPGTYTLEAWHETFGSQTQQIEVGPSETKQVSFTFNAS